MSTSRSGKRLPKCSARWKHACRKPQFERGSGWLRAGAQRVQAANEDIHRDGVDLVVIHRIEKGRAHFVKHKSADQRAQYLKRVDRLLAVRPALSNTLTATAASNSPSRRHSGESVVGFLKVAADRPGRSCANARSASAIARIASLPVALPMSRSSRARNSRYPLTASSRLISGIVSSFSANWVSSSAARSDAIRRSQRVASVASNSSMENFFSFASMDEVPRCTRERRGLEIPDAVLATDRRHSAASR